MALNGNMDMQKMVFIYMMMLQKMFTFDIVRVNFFVKIWHMEILQLISFGLKKNWIWYKQKNLI